jgi:hypothetical protein
MDLIPQVTTGTAVRRFTGKSAPYHLQELLMRGEVESVSPKLSSMEKSVPKKGEKT